MFSVEAQRAACAKNLMFYEYQVSPSPLSRSGTLAQIRVDPPEVLLRVRATVTRCPKGGKQSQPTGQVSEQFHIQFP